MFAVKKMAIQFKDDYAFLFDNEIAALQAANDVGVPRVATYVEQGYCLTGDKCLVLK